MPEFFYQIKGRKTEFDPDEFWATPWAWPPLFAGMVTANDKAAAREFVNEEYGRKFPMRVGTKNIESEPFLLNIMEVTPGDTRTRALFDIKECLACGRGFRVIDHYNNPHEPYKGHEYCRQKCKEDWTEKERNERMFSEEGNAGMHPPVIYRIVNTLTGACYVGQTTQAFTLRWWQHFFHGTDTKFHQAIKNSLLTDWSWHILEVIDIRGMLDAAKKRDHITAREQFWIEHFDSINKGYNTATAKVITTAPLLEGIEDDQ